jgi:hypothetical protein
MFPGVQNGDNFYLRVFRSGAMSWYKHYHKNMEKKIAGVCACEGTGFIQ